MPVTRIFSVRRLSRALRRGHRDDRGMALASVLVLMAAGIILSSVVASTVVASVQFSAATRAGVDSQAAAEAGIAVARASLINGGCSAANGRYVSAGQEDDVSTVNVDETAPAYDVQVQYSLDNQVSWIDGCPNSLNQPVRVVSTGIALQGGLSSDDSGDRTTVSALLGAIDTLVELNASGPAIYSYSTAGFAGSGKLISTGDYDTSIMIRSGDVECAGSSNGAANLVVKSGNFTAKGSCVIDGDVWINGSATLEGGASIGGSLTANSVDISGAVGDNVYSDGAIVTSWGGDIGGWASGETLEFNGGDVDGDAWARSGTTVAKGGNLAGTLYSAGSVTGSGMNMTRVVTTGRLTLSNGGVSSTTNAVNLTLSNGSMAGGTVSGSACLRGGDVTASLKVRTLDISGSCWALGSHTSWSGWTKLSLGTSPTPALADSPSKPTAAVVPEWVDFGAQSTDLTEAGWPGYTLATISGACTANDLYDAINVVTDGPVLIDALGCTNGLQYSGSSAEQVGGDSTKNGFRLHHDTVILAHDISFKGSTRFFTGGGDDVDLWLINPDVVGDAQPTCDGQSLEIGGNFTTSGVNIMFYTPCDLTLSSSQNLKGQIFVGSDVEFGGSGVLDFVPVGLPGYDLDTGFPDGPVYTEKDRNLLWLRNVNDAG